MESSDDEYDGVPENNLPREPSSRNSVKFVDEILNGPNELCWENFRMSKSIFYKLCDILQSKGLLRHTNRIKIEEQLAIFLYVIGHNLRTRTVQERFKYSGETISRHFNNVLNGITSISKEFYQYPSSDTPPEILNDPRFFPYFKDCVGAIDNVHFPVMVGVDEQGPFRNKKGQLSQNVLVACSFDLRFHYVLAGWEGTASELKVLNAALTRSYSLPVPEGKYYLGDAKYVTMPGFITPYYVVPDNTTEFPNSYGPQDARELFNQRHSMLQKATDRTLRALRERFPILLSATPYPLQTQVKLVIAACALHNYIRSERADDWIFNMYDQESMLQMEEPLPPGETGQRMMHAHDVGAQDLPFVPEQLEFAEGLRDSIANEMWNDYIESFSSM